MSRLKERVKRIEEYEITLNQIVKIIEVIDPIRNDTLTNHYKDMDGREMVRLPEHKSWIKKTKDKIQLFVKRKSTVVNYEPITFDLTDEICDSISKVLCEKRDWYRKRINEIENEEL